MQALLFVCTFEETILMCAHSKRLILMCAYSNTYTNKLTDMRTNNTRDNMTWMQKMQMSYSGVSQSIDTWLQNLLNSTKKQYGKYTIFGILVQSFRELASLIFTQIVVGTKENNLLTAEQTASVRGLAQLACYKCVGGIAASGKIALSFSYDAVKELGPTVFIKRYAAIKCKENSLMYYIDMHQDFAQLNINNELTGIRYEFAVRQGERKSQQYISDGESMTTFTIEERNLIVSEDSLTVTVGNELWTRYAGFDEMDRYSKGYIERWSYDGKLQIVFGNGTAGQIPVQNAVVNVEYAACEGYAGNILIDNDATFEWVNGMYDANTTAVSPKGVLVIEQLTDIVGGYNGEDIESIRSHAGSINRALVLHSADSIRTFMSRFGQYKILDVWSNTETQTIHVVLVPNIADKYVKASSIVYDYWSLPIAEFTIDSTDRQYLNNAIENTGDYVLLTDVQFDTVQLEFYQMLILVKKTAVLQNIEDVKQQLLDAAKAFVEDSWSNASTFVSRSAAIAKLEELDVIKSVDVQFIGNDEHIDNMGNIAPQSKDIVPLIRSQQGTDVGLSIKVLVENTDGSYVEC